MIDDVRTGHSISWERHTAAEVAPIAQSDGSVLVLPVGSVEQHGAHLPVGTDALLVDAVASIAAERVSEDVPILSLPPFWCGYSPHHLSLGGTISMEFDHMRAAVEDVVTSALGNGFDAVLLLNGHGGNVPLIGATVSTIGVEHREVDVLGLTYFELAAPVIDDIRESDVGGMAHGGEFETSLMLHLHEDLVHMDRVDATPMAKSYELSRQDMFEGGPLAVYSDFEEYSTDGAIGTPSLASADKGERLLEAIVDELATLLADIHERNR